MGADDYIIKPFNNRELLSRVRNTLIRIDRNRCANPLTGLSGNIEIQSELNHRLANRFPIEVIYCDLDNFKAFNDVYGFAKGDSAIRLTADIIRDAVHQAGTRDDFIGHIGGDDFLIITAPERAKIFAELLLKTLTGKSSSYIMKPILKTNILLQRTDWVKLRNSQSCPFHWRLLLTSPCSMKTPCNRPGCR